MAQKIESGLQMFSRVTHRPDLEGLNSVIFPQGPHPGQTIEITGEEGTGKTILVTDFLARCLLPKTFQELHFPGKQCGALFINTNHHFDIFKLAEILQYHIKSSCRKLDSSTVQEIIKNALKNLTVINCYTSEQFQATLLNLESLILKETNISLLIVDTLGAFYWTQRVHSNVSYNAYYSSITHSLKALANKHNVTVFYTKPSAMKQEVPKKHTDIRIHLKKSGEGAFEMEIINYCDELEDLRIKYNIRETFIFQN